VRIDGKSYDVPDGRSSTGPIEMGARSYARCLCGRAID
jgi:hypothetical protein